MRLVLSQGAQSKIEAIGEERTPCLRLAGKRSTALMFDGSLKFLRDKGNDYCLIPCASFTSSILQNSFAHIAVSFTAKGAKLKGKRLAKKAHKDINCVDVGWFIKISSCDKGNDYCLIPCASFTSSILQNSFAHLAVNFTLLILYLKRSIRTFGWSIFFARNDYI